MATITISGPNITKSYTLSAGEVQRLLDYAANQLGGTPTNAEAEAYIIRKFFILMREELYRFEKDTAAAAARASTAKIQLTES